MTRCECRSGRDYADCCQPLHQGHPASHPEALMRSRFCAFARGNTDYLSRSWHADTRPANLSLDSDEHWVNLDILDSDEDGDNGSVHFRAICRIGQTFSVLEEISRFVREGGHWFYLAGKPSVTPLKPGRNDPCPCGSGKKFKKCCG